MKVLILRYSSMGDILLTTPVCTVLKYKYPNCTIDWIVKDKFKNTLTNNPDIDNLYSFSNLGELLAIRNKIKKIKYNMVFDLHKNLKTFIINSAFKRNIIYKYNKNVLKRTLLVYFKKAYDKITPVTQNYFQALNKAGIKTPDSWGLIFKPHKKSYDLIDKYTFFKDPYIVIAPGASYFNKRWPKEKFKTLIKQIQIEFNNIKNIVLVGYGQNEKIISAFISQNTDAIDLVNELSLDETAIVIEKSDLIVSNDSGLLHIAECFKKKSVAIFGATTEELGFYPYSTEYRICEVKDLPCRPCTHFGKKTCPKKHFKCMNDISGDMVLSAIKDILN